MASNQSDEIASKYAKLDADTLKKIITEDFRDYTPVAIEIAQKELNSRGHQPVEVPSNPLPKVAIEKEIKPVIKWVIRILLYLFWPIVWIFIFGTYGMIREGLRGAIMNFLQNTVGIESFVIIAKTYGIIAGLIYVLLILILIMGFVIITKETKINKPGV